MGSRTMDPHCSRFYMDLWTFERPTIFFFLYYIVSCNYVYLLYVVFSFYVFTAFLLSLFLSLFCLCFSCCLSLLSSLFHYHHPSPHAHDLATLLSSIATFIVHFVRLESASTNQSHTHWHSAFAFTHYNNGSPYLGLVYPSIYLFGITFIYSPNSTSAFHTYILSIQITESQNVLLLFPLLC